MYGLPQNTSLAFFEGKTLLQVCIGAHDLVLNFDGDVSVTVTSSVGCGDSNGVIEQYDDFRHAASTLATLLNQRIASAQGDKAGTLILKFDSDGILMIYDDSNEYESYTIKNGKQLIVV